ncbi:11032_t:CDS:1 [Paraglomus occultum]|uniref:11032_t:CDS:1 n=1 Tax=Paraglomus occultum TaxID=144539 RepID=A0A9N9FR27_9GLOM|nr:11032_t:CDS:1 [Paraglomus occultum]
MPRYPRPSVKRKRPPPNKEPFTIPKDPYPFDKQYHYPFCFPGIAGEEEDSDCQPCKRLWRMQGDMYEAKNRQKDNLYYNHATAWREYRDGTNSWDQIVEAYDPKHPSQDHYVYKTYRDKYREAVLQRIKEVDEYFAIKRGQINQHYNGKDYTVKWNSEGIQIDEQKLTWFQIKRNQRQLARRYKKATSIIFDFRGPYARCWCPQIPELILNDDEECEKCRQMVINTAIIGLIAKEQWIKEKKIHPWFTPIETRNLTWQKTAIPGPFEVQLLSKDAVLPTKAYNKDAAWDIYAAEDARPNQNGVLRIPTHIKLRYSPGHYGQLLTKSSQGERGEIVLAGVLDEGFTGEIQVLVTRVLHPEEFRITKGMKIAQLVIHSAPRVDIDGLTDTLSIRGKKGFGSSDPKRIQIIETNSVQYILSIQQDKDEKKTAEIDKLKKQYQDIFIPETESQGMTIKGTTISGFEHKIFLTDYTPIKQRVRPLAPIKAEYLEKEIQTMLDKNIIRKCPQGRVSWASPIVIVGKRGGKMRMCVDYRQLNDVTIKDPHPLPNIQEMIDKMGKAQYFTTLDLASGYWQVKMFPAHRKYTAFICPFGHYSFNVMPFGLCNAPATFQSMMETILLGFRAKFCEVYLDDIIIFSATWEEHLHHIQQIFQRLREYGVVLKESKCHFGKQETEYLGFMLTPDGYRTLDRIVKSVQNFENKSIGEKVDKKFVQSFLGTCGYYMKFIKDYATIAKPLSAFTRDKKKWREPAPPGTRRKWIYHEEENDFRWGQAQYDAFEKLKEILAKTTEDGGVRLQYPQKRWQYVVRTDASKQGIGAALLQIDPRDNQEWILQYRSRVFRPAEEGYDMHEKEALAIFWACKHWFYQYLYGAKFKLYTDHHSLIQAFGKRDKSCGERVRLWALQLSDLQYDIIHVEGKRNGLADWLSRNPLAVEQDIEEEDMPFVKLPPSNQN